MGSKEIKVNRFKLPGDKSLSHRFLLFAGQTNEEVTITNIASSQDVAATRKAVDTLFRLSQADFKNIVFRTKVLARESFTKNIQIDCGNSGTLARLLPALIQRFPIDVTLVGDSSLSGRPMKRIIAPLENMGFSIACPSGTLPLTIKTSIAKPKNWVSSVASAQVKTAVLFGAMAVNKPVIVTEPRLSRDHTERLINALSGKIITKSDTNGTHIEFLEFNPKGFQVDVAGDPSSAMFLIAFALLSKNHKVILENVLLNPGRIGALKLLKSSGANIEIEVTSTILGEPCGTIEASSGSYDGFTIDSSNLVSMIDEVPILALLATNAKSNTIIIDAQELRVKESDRIKATVEMINAIGGIAIETKNGLTINPSTIRSGQVISLGDHRIAMTGLVADAVLKSKDRGMVQVDDTDCINTSFPEFFPFIENLQVDQVDAIVIDGPVGSGKSTVAKKIAAELNITMLNTGAIFRSIAWVLDHETHIGETLLVGANSDKSKAASIGDIFGTAKCIKLIEQHKQYNWTFGSDVLEDGNSIFDQLYTEKISQLTSIISSFKEIRDYSAKLQKDWAQQNQPFIAEGRDLTSKIFVNAKCKIFLGADINVRAKRIASDPLRTLNIKSKNQANSQSDSQPNSQVNSQLNSQSHSTSGIKSKNVEKVLVDIQKRDARDSQRAQNPLVLLSDVTYVDSSELSLDQTVKSIIGHYQKF